MKENSVKDIVVNMRVLKINLMFISLVLLLASLLAPTNSYAAAYDLVFGKAVTQLAVPLNQSRIMVFDESIDNISVGNPDIADIVILESKKTVYPGEKFRFNKHCCLE